MLPEGRPHDTVRWSELVPLVSWPRSIIVSTWSLFLNAGVKVSVCVVVTPRLFEELAVVRLLSRLLVSFHPRVLSDSGMNWSSYRLKMLNTTLPS